MSGYVLSPRAQTDLDEIWDYTERNWGKEQAEAYIRLIGAAIKAIASSPERGKACDDIREGYRKCPAGAHMISSVLSMAELTWFASFTAGWISTATSARSKRGRGARQPLSKGRRFQDLVRDARSLEARSSASCCFRGAPPARCRRTMG